MFYIINAILIGLIALNYNSNNQVTLALSIILAFTVFVEILVFYMNYYYDKTKIDTRLTSTAIKICSLLERLKPYLENYIDKYNEFHKKQQITQLNIVNLNLLCDAFPEIYSDKEPIIKDILALGEEYDAALRGKMELNRLHFWYLSETIKPEEVYRIKQEIYIPISGNGNYYPLHKQRTDFI